MCGIAMAVTRGDVSVDMEQTQADILKDLHELGDSSSQYSYLIECAAECEPFGEDLHTDENLVRDCAVRTWVCVERHAGRAVLVGDSESVIVRGAIALLEEIFNGRSAGEVARFEFKLLDDEMFTKHFSPKQRIGLAQAAATVKQLMLGALGDDGATVDS